MRKALAVLTLILCLLSWGCTKAKKIIPPGQEKQSPAPTHTPAPSPTPTPLPSPKPEDKSTPKRAVPSSGEFVVTVDVSEQTVYVSKDGEQIKSMVCSTGIVGDRETETPLGKYKINRHYGDFFYSPVYKVGARYWVGFIGSTFLFHSVPTDIQGNVMQYEAERLGMPASHGCVRMSMDDAYWFYETVPEGADVIIQE